MRRRTPSLFHKELKNIIHSDLPVLNSEKLPEYRKFFVDLGILNKYFNNTNQLICGRRGTGKTHLLGTIHESINSDLMNKSLSIFIPLTDVNLSPSIYGGDSEIFYFSKYARGLFLVFLNVVIENLISEIHTKYVQTNLTTKKIAKSVDARLIHLMELVHESTLVKTPSKHRITEKDLHHQKKQTKTGVALKGTLPSQPLDVKFGLSGIREDETTVERTQEYDAEMVPHLTQVKVELRKIIQLLGLNTLYILIDEWMQIDKTTRLKIQPYFAEYLKRIFFGDRNITVKIASIWHETDLYDRQDVRISRGLELGDDIHMGTDLDTAFVLDWEFLSNFFKLLLFKRLSHEDEKLLQFQTKSNIIDDIFIHELFDNEKNFRELILACHGMPRDFLKIFHKCCMVIDCDFQKKAISKSVIRKVAQDIFLTEKRKSLEKGSPASKLFYKINSYLGQTHHRFFLVENETSKHSVSLRKLVDERLIHPIPSARTPRGVRDHYKCFDIDYGNYMDWYYSSEVSSSLKLSQDFIPAIEKPYDRYILEILAEEETTITCKHCRHVFSKMERPYLFKKYCPNCFEKT